MKITNLNIENNVVTITFSDNEIIHCIINAVGTKYYLNSLGIKDNSYIFNKLDIKDRCKFVENIVKYPCSSGDFPWVKSKEDVIKVLKALEKVNKSNNIVSIRKKKSINFNFKL